MESEENELIMAVENEITKKIEELKKEKSQGTEDADEKLKKVAHEPIVKKNNEASNCYQLKIKDYKQILPLSSKAHRLSKTKSLVDCLVLFETIYENPNFKNDTQNFEKHFELSNLDFNINNNYPNDEKHFLNLYLFCNRKSTIKLLDLEYGELEATGQLSICNWLFDIWKGNIEKLMTELDSNHLVNEFFFTLYQISITPTIYKDNKFFDNYLQQLLSANEFHKVALYYIVSYKIHDAIELYLDHNQFQFALCLAQLRLNKTLPEDNCLFNKVLSKYANYSTYNGDYETSVLAYVRIKDLSSASTSLMRRIPANEEQKVLIQDLASKFSKYDSSICVNINKCEIKDDD